jgi:hypothetical protein
LIVPLITLFVDAAVMAGYSSRGPKRRSRAAPPSSWFEGADRMESSSERNVRREPRRER